MFSFRFFPATRHVVFGLGACCDRRLFAGVRDWARSASGDRWRRPGERRPGEQRERGADSLFTEAEARPRSAGDGRERRVGEQDERREAPERVPRNEKSRQMIENVYINIVTHLRHKDLGLLSPVPMTAASLFFRPFRRAFRRRFVALAESPKLGQRLGRENCARSSTNFQFQALSLPHGVEGSGPSRSVRKSVKTCSWSMIS